MTRVVTVLHEEDSDASERPSHVPYGQADLRDRAKT